MFDLEPWAEINSFNLDSPLVSMERGNHMVLEYSCFFCGLTKLLDFGLSIKSNIGEFH